jgi:5-methylcytosine-specific restriction endonuclease McrA
MQTKKNKQKKESTFGKKKSSIKRRSQKMRVEKENLSNLYYEYLHTSNQKCAVCGGSCDAIHHITDIKRIKGKRRVWNRVVTLCNKHHDNYSNESIHVLSREKFYDKIMSLEDLLSHSKRLFLQYLEYKG